jgi:hypothetical protein
MGCKGLFHAITRQKHCQKVESLRKYNLLKHKPHEESAGRSNILRLKWILDYEILDFLPKI